MFCAIASAVAGCGSPAVKAGLDPCIVGSWRTTGVHGTVTSSDGTLHIPLTGGAGQKTVLRGDGTVTVVYDGSAPQVGTGTDGSTYTINVTGQIAGTVKTDGDQVTLDITDPQDATQTISKDGAVLQTVNPPGEEVSTYACSAHRSLTVTTNGISLAFVPS